MPLRRSTRVFHRLVMLTDHKRTEIVLTLDTMCVLTAVGNSREAEYSHIKTRPTIQTFETDPDLDGSKSLLYRDIPPNSGKKPELSKFLELLYFTDNTGSQWRAIHSDFDTSTSVNTITVISRATVEPKCIACDTCECPHYTLIFVTQGM